MINNTAKLINLYYRPFDFMCKTTCITFCVKEQVKFE